MKFLSGFIHLLAMLIFCGAASATDAPSAPSYMQESPKRLKAVGAPKKQWATESTPGKLEPGVNREEIRRRVIMGPPAPVYCENDVFEPTIYVNFSAMRPVEKYDVPIEGLNAMSGRDYGPDDIEALPEKEYLLHQTAMHKNFRHTIGLTRAALEYSYGADFLSRAINEHAACVFLDSLTFDAAYYFTVYVASEIFTKHCKEKQVRDHELLHVEATSKTAARYAALIQKDLRAYADKYRPLRLAGKMQEREVARVRGEIAAIIQKHVTAMREDIAKLHVLIDSQGEYAYGALACRNGRI